MTVLWIGVSLAALFIGICIGYVMGVESISDSYKRTFGSWKQ